MITKKWVDLKLAVEREDHTRALDRLRERIAQVQKGMGFTEIESPLGNVVGYFRPEIPVIEKLGAICAYLGIEIVKEAKAEAVVARKIKSVKK